MKRPLSYLLACASWVTGAWLASPPALHATVPPRIETSQGNADLFPGDGTLPGWTRVGPPRVYTEADLYGYIDGGAELFFEFGFEQLTQQRYTHQAGEVGVDLYRMRDPTAALGIYLMKCGRETPTSSGMAARHTANRYQLMAVRDRFYLVVNRLSGGETADVQLARVASAVVDRLPSSAPPALDALLPKTGLVPGSIRLVRGPYALQSLCTLGEGDILLLGGRVTAVAGSYVVNGQEPHVIIRAVYPDAPAAARAMAHLQANLDRYLTPLSRSPARLVFRDYEQRYGLIAVEGQTLTVTLHLTERPR